MPNFLLHLCIFLIVSLSFNINQLESHDWCGKKCANRRMRKSQQKIEVAKETVCKDDESSAEKLHKKQELEEVSNHLPDTKCSYLPGKFIINPYKDLRSHLVEKKNFASLCLKCSACLAIAQHITERIWDLLREPEEYDCYSWKEYVERNMNEICNEGFKNYDLREYNNQTFLTPANELTKHVTTAMDGKWTTTLREICKYYVNHLDINSFYDSVLIDDFSMETFLCRGQGIFRDCVNLPLHIVELPGQDLHSCICLNCGDEIEPEFNQ